MNDELIRDIYERLGGIQAKLDDVRAIREVSHAADKKASEALQKSDENARNIANISATMKWAIGITASVVVPLAIFVLGQIFK